MYSSSSYASPRGAGTSDDDGDSEQFRAALAEALALAKDPRHVIALSRVYAHAVGAVTPSSPLAGRALEAEDVPGLPRYAPPPAPRASPRPRRRPAASPCVSVSDFDDDDDDSFRERVGIEAPSTRAIVAGSTYVRGGSPRGSALAAAVRDREREYRQLLARAGAETTKGDVLDLNGHKPSARTSRALVGAIERLERSSDELRAHQRRADEAAAQTTRAGRRSRANELRYDRVAADVASAELRVSLRYAEKRAKKERLAARRSRADAQLARGLAAAIPAIYSPDSVMRKKAALRILRDFKDHLR